MYSFFKHALLLLLLTLAAPQELWAQYHFEQLKADFLAPNSSQVMVAAHRAVHHEYPENSLPSIQQAIEMGVHIIEIDVKVSTDGVPFLMHDGTVDRTTNGSGDPEKMNWKELQALSLLYNGKVTPHKIPSLEEVLTLADDKILIDLDLKTTKIQPIIRLVEQSATEDQVFFFDSDYEVLEEVQKANDALMLMPRAYSLEMADSALQRFTPEVVHIDPSFNNAETVSLIKSHGSRVWINALGDTDKALARAKGEESLEQLLQYGANIVQTDEPALLLKLVEPLAESTER